MSAGPESLPRRVEVLVIGSGAGGAATAARLAGHGYEVLVLEEGVPDDTSTIATHSPAAFTRLYRNGGLTPILGPQRIARVEGCCLGGSTEINSAFWHRLPEDVCSRWQSDAMLAECSAAVLRPYYEELERELSVSYLDPAAIPASSALFRRGIEHMGWQCVEVPRCQKDAANPFAPGGKQSMQRTYLPKAAAAGARFHTRSRVLRVLHDGARAHGALVDAGERGAVRIAADHVFVCAGAIESAALLRCSGITRNVGNNLCIHPMIKAAAVFEEEVGADQDVLPVYQVKEFWPDISIGGSVFTPGFFALLLADGWRLRQHAMADWQRSALYYAATRGLNRGTVRALPGRSGGALVRYRLGAADQRNLSVGLARLGEILFAAGARRVYPSVRDHAVWTSAEQCRGLLREPLPLAAMSLSTVHVFSSCPMGENPDLCATDSFGKVNGFRNLYVNDASLLPDSPGVNPQGTVMAVALRNADHFHGERRRRTPRPRSSSAPRVLVTGAPGWLGTRLVEILTRDRALMPELTACFGGTVRCLVRPDADPEPIAVGDEVEIVTGDVRDAAAARTLCDSAAGAVLFHLAGVIHPAGGIAELEEVNVGGTRRLLHAAAEAGIRRVVAVSSNSPFGFNAHPEERFDETSPYRPYMAYGRSKQRMEELVHEAHAGGRLETVIVRPPWFYGPHQPPRQTLFFRMIKNGRFPILGHGRQKRSLGYVDNICQGLLRAAASAAANGQAYWIADERPYSIVEIVDTVRQVLENEFGIPCARRQLRLPAALGAAARLADRALQAAGFYNQKIHVLSEMGETIACSIDKAKRELGYAPAVSLYQGMTRSVSWCLTNGLHI